MNKPVTATRDQLQQRAIRAYNEKCRYLKLAKRAAMPERARYERLAKEFGLEAARLSAEYARHSPRKGATA